MPSSSKAQFRFMQMLAHNKKRAKKEGLSPEKAKEYVSKNVGEKSYENLPEKSNKFKKLKSKLKGK